MPFVVPLIMAGTAIAKGISGAVQAKKLRDRYNSLTESTYIPPSLNMALSNAQLMANQSRYAGQDQDEANVEQTAANQTAAIQRSTKSSTNMINAGSAVAGNTQRQFANIRANGAKIRQGNMGNLNNVLFQKANQERNNRNQFLAAKSALLGARDQQSAANVAGVTNAAEDYAKISSGYGGGQQGQYWNRTQWS